MKHLKPFNESYDTGELQDILNIAIDEGMSVGFFRMDGIVAPYIIPISEFPDMISIEKLDVDHKIFYRIVTNIYDRVVQMGIVGNNSYFATDDYRKIRYFKESPGPNPDFLKAIIFIGK